MNIATLKSFRKVYNRNSGGKRCCCCHDFVGTNNKRFYENHAERQLRRKVKNELQKMKVNTYD